MYENMSLSTRTLFVGNLPCDIREKEVEGLFCKYGRVVALDLKIPLRSSSFAFVEFEDARDAEDAIRGRNGYKFDGQRLRVQLAHGGRVSSSGDRCTSGGSRAGLTRRTDFRVHVTGLPSSASWQDLKDHMRRAGDVCYSQVFRECDGMRGIVDYANYDDMKNAIRKLDDSLFFNQLSKAFIRVEEYNPRYHYSRSRSRSPYYSRSRSTSHSHSYDSRSRSSQSRSISSRSCSKSSLPHASSKEHKDNSRTIHKCTCLLLPNFDRKSMGRSSRTLYVGNLPGDIREREVEDLFYKYGPIVHIDLKIPPRPPGFAFVEFEDARDAEDAIRGRDGYKFDGQRLRVELAHGGRVSPSVDRYSSGGSRGGLSRRSDYRVYVTGLPSSASWQDLKDHMRRAGDVCFSQVFRDRDGMRGIVDYTNYDDMKYAIRKLDDSLFRNQFSKAYIRVEEYDRKHSYSRSRSRSPYYSRSKTPSRSPSYDSRSWSYSPGGKYSRRSRSRSVSSRSRSESSLTPASRSRSGSRTPPSSSRYRHGDRSPSRSISRSRSPSVRSD
ncbi:hypothetical protein QVD17_28413 [Tagetes erecta]|uniref:RRM domain-containing protein n=1 Tax=Tagetes erecta TaxID=13708 RepID=A0AAD8KAM3_TARER|nr:hypothetical protein QVD17_28413 [Tagetes erecta]